MLFELLILIVWNDPKPTFDELGRPTSFVFKAHRERFLTEAKCVQAWLAYSKNKRFPPEGWRVSMLHGRDDQCYQVRDDRIG